MPADTDTDSLIFESADPIKALPDAPEGKMKVGAYAIRFSDASEKDLTGEFFTKATKFGKNHGDGAMTLFHHGLPLKGLENLCDADFESATTRVDDVGIFAETVLDMADEYQAEIAKMIAAGKLNWSSGSAGHAMRRKSTGEITRWPISEFSFTPTPAEPRLPAIRPLKSLAEPAPIVDTPKAPVATPPKIIVMPEATKTAEEIAADTARAIEDGIKARELVTEDIRSIGKAWQLEEDAEKFVRDRKSVQAFKDFLFDELKKRGTVKAVDLNRGMIGMGEKDITAFSLIKACRDLVMHRKLDGLEREVNDATLKAIGRDIRQGQIGSFVLPDDVLRHRTWVKAQTIGTATAGGFTMQPTMGPMIEILRNAPLVMQAGASSLGGLVGDVWLPVQTGATAAYWVSETGTLTDSQIAFGQKKLTPHRLGSTIPYSTQFLAQSSLDAESFIRNDATTVLAIEKDRAALLGSGVNGEPLGISLTPNVGTHVTYGAAATWAKTVLSETSIANANAVIGPMAWLLDAATVGAWKIKLKDSVAGAQYLIDAANGMSANGYPVYRTNQLSAAHQSFFGVWNTFVMASWSGMEVIVNPFSLDTSAQVRITFNELCDQLVRQPTAFEVSTDSAAQ